ncbi:hypothetical protein [Microbispora sp. H10830]|uniref:hypothetical protein n=1 Tax=Microbispora sp. H10830 TaxID=2729109 RepID=UPI001600B02F|nr:hypothetical protein [Microbispora sp. H10830]
MLTAKGRARGLEGVGHVPQATGVVEVEQHAAEVDDDYTWAAHVLSFARCAMLNPLP